MCIGELYIFAALLLLVTSVLRKAVCIFVRLRQTLMIIDEAVVADTFH